MKISISKERIKNALDAEGIRQRESKKRYARKRGSDTHKQRTRLQENKQLQIENCAVKVQALSKSPMAIPDGRYRICLYLTNVKFTMLEKFKFT